MVQEQETELSRERANGPDCCCGEVKSAQGCRWLQEASYVYGYVYCGGGSGMYLNADQPTTIRWF